MALDLLTEHSCGEGPWHNLLVEGDNFDALRYLRMTHAGQVKCIYIDPPYNTGNKDFIYNDRFVDKDDVWKHSKWLEYLYRRLLLARDLLATVSFRLPCLMLKLPAGHSGCCLSQTILTRVNCKVR